MKITLVYFNNISKNKKVSVAYTTYCLANKLLKEGLLERVICLNCDKDIGIPQKNITSLQDNVALKILFKILQILEKNIRIVHSRSIREWIFDLFATHIMASCGNTLIFCARPLFLRTIRRAKSLGNKVWVQVLAPHPLVHYAFVRNEELRYGVASRGATTNVSRMARLTQAINESDRVFTLSSEIADFTYKSYADFVEHDKLVEIRNYFSVDKGVYIPGHDLSERKEGGAALRFMCVSFMNLTKGIPYLLTAWRILAERYSVSAKLVLVGQIDRNLKQIIQDRYAQIPNVEYVGYVHDLVEQFRQADVLVSPSIADAGPTTILEAMSTGLPVIASRNCGFASLITEGQDGFTYDYNDVERLVEIMYWFFENIGEIKRMGNNARNSVADFSIDKYTDELASVFKGEA